MSLIKIIITLFKLFAYSSIQIIKIKIISFNLKIYLNILLKFWFNQNL